MASPVFTDGDAAADVVVVGSGVVGALIAEQLAGEGRSVLVLDAGLRIERGQVVENWRNMPFANRAGSTSRGSTRNRSSRRPRSTGLRMIMSGCRDRTGRASNRAT